MVHKNRRSFCKEAMGLVAAAAAPMLNIRTARAQSEPIKIGFPTSLSGAYAAETLDQVRCAQLAIDEFNASGGFKGRNAVLISRDDKLNPAEGAAKALELIEKERVDFIVGTLSAAVQLAINNVTRERKVIFIPVSQSDAIIEAKGWSKYTFHEALTPQMTTDAVGRYAFKNFGTKVAFLSADYAYGHEMVRGFKRAGEKLNLDIVAEIRHPLGAADFSAFLPRIQAARPDVLFVCNYGSDQLNAIKQATEFGVKRNTKIVTPIASLTARRSGGNAVFDDVVAGAAYNWALEDTVPSAKAFNTAFKKIHNSMPDYGSHAYAAVRSLLECVRQAGSTEADVVAAKLRELKYDYCKGGQYYRECDHQSMQSVLILKSRRASVASDERLFDIVHIDNGVTKNVRSCKELGHVS